MSLDLQRRMLVEPTVAQEPPSGHHTARGLLVPRQLVALASVQLVVVVPAILVRALLLLTASSCTLDTASRHLRSHGLLCTHRGTPGGIVRTSNVDHRGFWLVAGLFANSTHFKFLLAQRLHLCRVWRRHAKQQGAARREPTSAAKGPLYKSICVRDI